MPRPKVSCLWRASNIWIDMLSCDLSYPLLLSPLYKQLSIESTANPWHRRRQNYLLCLIYFFSLLMFSVVKIKYFMYQILNKNCAGRYEAVFEVSGPQPDFHRIEKFGPLDLTEFLHSNARWTAGISGVSGFINTFSSVLPVYWSCRGQHRSRKYFGKLFMLLNYQQQLSISSYFLLFFPCGS